VEIVQTEFAIEDLHEYRWARVKRERKMYHDPIAGKVLERNLCWSCHFVLSCARLILVSEDDVLIK
jgi:hypothetical protein